MLMRAPFGRPQLRQAVISASRTSTNPSEKPEAAEDDAIEAVVAPPEESSDHTSGGAMAPFQVFGLDATPELSAIFLVYFVQGILGISRLAISYYFKDDLHMDPAQMAVYTGISTVPWLIKPIYGFASDTFPILGYRRRSYLIICGLLGAIAWGGICFGKPGAVVTSALLCVGSVGTACSDVVVDSVVVERCRGKPASVAGSFQSLCWGSAAVGGVASSYFSGSLIEQYGVSFVFGITALFPLLISASALLVEEEPVKGIQVGSASSDSSPSGDSGNGTGGKGDESVLMALREQTSTLWGAIRQPRILYPAIFVFLWQATPSADSAMFYFYTNQLHYSPEFLGRVRLVGSIASLLGIWLYNGWLKTVPLRSMFKWCAVIGTVLGLSQVVLVTGLNQKLGLSNELFSLSDEIILTVLGKISFMPVLVLASRICPEGVEATLFATLMSILNGGSISGSFLGSLLTAQLGVTATSFDNLALLVTICSLGALLPLPLLSWLPPDEEASPVVKVKDIEDKSE